MKITNNIKRTFEPLLQQFCLANEQIGIDEDFSSIFIPHTMSDYSKADHKIFYFGRDTYGWAPISQLMKDYSENNLSNYIQETSKWVNNFGFLEYNNNKSSGFWTLVIRLHLRIKGFTENLWISESLPEEYYKHINDFGWGNTNAIEVPKSLENQGIWEALDKDKYWSIKEQSKFFDKLIHTIKTYKPNLVFIFNWDCDEKLFLDGLDYQVQKLDLIGNHFCIYHLPETNTKVIWTVHPTRARWIGYGTDSMIDEIVKYLNKEKILTE
ncbi:hypothetical protein LJC30_06785 [Odoribacter sp. OttesenSCG-928-L07]|nr:hypothetical protein [Odoribacter sp. OttesenSCG-928-L07]